MTNERRIGNEIVSSLVTFRRTRVTSVDEETVRIITDLNTTVAGVKCLMIDWSQLYSNPSVLLLLLMGFESWPSKASLMVLIDTASIG